MWAKQGHWSQLTQSMSCGTDRVSKDWIVTPRNGTPRENQSTSQYRFCCVWLLPQRLHSVAAESLVRSVMVKTAPPVMLSKEPKRMLISDGSYSCHPQFLHHAGHPVKLHKAYIIVANKAKSSTINHSDVRKCQWRDVDDFTLAERPLTFESTKANNSSQENLGLAAIAASDALKTRRHASSAVFPERRTAPRNIAQPL